MLILSLSILLRIYRTILMTILITEFYPRFRLLLSYTQKYFFSVPAKSYQKTIIQKLQIYQISILRQWNIQKINLAISILNILMFVLILGDTP